MNTEINFTRHGGVRAQQRGISKQIIEYLLLLGRKHHCRKGALRYSFDAASRRKLKHLVGVREYVGLERKLNSFVIVSRDGRIITVGYQYRRIWH